MNLYAIAVMASKMEKDGRLLIKRTACSSGHVVAKSDDEAQGKAIRFSKEEEFPKKEGWYGHQAIIDQIPADLMRKVLGLE